MIFSVVKQWYFSSLAFNRSLCISSITLKTFFYCLCWLSRISSKGTEKWWRIYINVSVMFSPHIKKTQTLALYYLVVRDHRQKYHCIIENKRFCWLWFVGNYLAYWWSLTLFSSPLINVNNVLWIIYWFFFLFLNCLEAAPEAVKRKAVEETDAAEVVDESAPTPEKKSKVEEAAHENGAAEEVVA